MTTNRDDLEDRVYDLNEALDSLGMLMRQLKRMDSDDAKAALAILDAAEDEISGRVHELNEELDRLPDEDEDEYLEQEYERSVI